MSFTMMVACDGHRYGAPCRGALPTGVTGALMAWARAREAGWRVSDGGLALCPSRNHDEEGS